MLERAGTIPSIPAGGTGSFCSIEVVVDGSPGAGSDPPDIAADDAGAGDADDAGDGGTAGDMAEASGTVASAGSRRTHPG